MNSSFPSSPLSVPGGSSKRLAAAGVLALALTAPRLAQADDASASTLVDPVSPVTTDPAATPPVTPQVTTPPVAPVPAPMAPPPPLAPVGAAPGGDVTVAGGSGGASGKERDKDDKPTRNFELFYVSADLGGSYANLTTFSSSTFGLQQTSAGGALVGLGAGVRLLFLTLGARARLNALSAFNLWEVNGEVGFHIPVGKADPYIGLHAGYAFVGSLSDATFENPTQSAFTGIPNDVTVHGWDAGLSLGFDYYLDPLFSLGFDASAAAYFLRRPPAPLPAGFNQLPPSDQQAVRTSDIYGNSGDAAGFGGTLSIHAGLHLGI